MSETKEETLPAIAGGIPAKQTPYGEERRYGEEELAELEEALLQGSLFYTQGKKVHQLEAAFAEKNGVPHAVATSSGTASIHAALIAAGISPGDEVIVSPITDMGSIAPILYQGAVPVFADLDPHTYLVTPETVAAVLTPQTRAILAVHLGGNACDMDGLRALAGERDLALIEDCAQAFGCTYNGQPIGTLGDVGCFSYNEFKHISCGDGGVVLTRDDLLAHRLRLATDKAYDRTAGGTKRNPAFLANNYRMTELQGAVALAQLHKLDSIVARRRDWCSGLNERLAGVPGLDLPQQTANSESSWWFYLLRVRPDELGADADAFVEALSAEGIRAGAHYIGQCIYEYPIFVDHSAFERGEHAYQRREYGPGLCPEAENILETCVMLPVKEYFTETDMVEVANGIRKVANWLTRQV